MGRFDTWAEAEGEADEERVERLMRKTVRSAWTGATGAHRLTLGAVAVMLAVGLAAYAASSSLAASGPPARPGALPGGEGSGVIRVSPVLQGPGVPSAPAGQPLAVISTVTLVTGQRVKLDMAPDGQQVAMPDGPAGAAEPGSSQYTGFTLGGDTYMIPDEDVPYVGSVLDPRLFDVSYLVRAGLDDAHAASLPVTISYTGRRPLSLPGVRVSRASGTATPAVVVKAQASQLGALLASRRAASQAGRPASAAALLPGIERISLAPPPSAPLLPADPEQPSASAPDQASSAGLAWHTLHLRFIDLHGKSAAFIGLVQNVDNLNYMLSLVSAQSVLGPQSGKYAISVPQGTYSLEFNILTVNSSGTSARSALVVKPQVTVSRDETLTFDARTARPYSARLATSPGSNYVDNNLISVGRSSVTGGSVYSTEAFAYMFLYSENGTPLGGLLAAPTAPVTKGKLTFAAMSEFFDPAASPSKQPPRYYFVFPHPGSIPSSLSYTVPRASLTTVRERVYGSVSGASTTQELLYPWIQMSWGEFDNLGFDTPDENVWPGNRTDYWYSSMPSRTLWWNELIPPDRESGAGVSYPQLRVLVGRRWVIGPGRHISESWNEGPQVPPPVASGRFIPNLSFGLGFICAACRQADIGVVYPQLGGDSDSSHYDLSDVGRGTAFRFYRNGRLALSSEALPAIGPAVYPWPDFPSGFVLPLLRRAATYRLVWAADVRAGDFGAITTTDWTFRSGPGDRPAHLPRGDVCAPDPNQGGCSFLPLLYLTYHLALNFLSQAKAGQPFKIAFTVEHQQNQAPPAGVSATVSASFNNGKTWTAPQPAASLGGDRFAATISEPQLSATSGFVALRVTARDSAGNAVTQTIIKAYGLTS
jgi:hypothetical protein